MTEHEEVAKGIAHTEGVVDEQKPSPEVARALERVEQRVEHTLATNAAITTPPLTKAQTWILTAVILGFQILTLVVLYAGVGSYGDQQKEQKDYRDYVKSQLAGLGCMLLVPPGDRNQADAAKCGVYTVAPK